MIIKINSREITKEIPRQPIKWTFGETNEDKVLFLSGILTKEVNQGTEKQQLRNVKKMKKLYRNFLLILGGVGIPSHVSASPLNKTINEPITPELISEFGMTVALITVSIGVALSMTLLSVAGMYRMFRKQKEATAWTNDIIRGLVQILIAIPTVYILYYMAQLLFKNLGTLSGLF